MTDVEIGLAIQEAERQFADLANHARKTKKQIIQQLAESFEKADFPLDMICAKIVEEIHEKRKLMSKSQIVDSLDERFKLRKNLPEDLTKNGQVAPENRIEESPKPVVIDTSGEPVAVDDETNEKHDERSEQSITDEVNKSMHPTSTSTTSAPPTITFTPLHSIHEDRPEESMNPYESAMAKEIKNYNKIIMDKTEEIEQYKARLKEAEEKTKDTEYIKLEQKLLRLEEINERLINENKQYSEAVLKKSFENATHVKTDPQQIKNYEQAITSLEAMLKQKNEQIEELNQKLESFEHIDKAIEHQPLELDVKPFIGVIFANRGSRVIVLHDGKKVLKITGGS